MLSKLTNLATQEQIAEALERIADKLEENLVPGGGGDFFDEWFSFFGAEDQEDKIIAMNAMTSGVLSVGRSDLLGTINDYRDEHELWPTDIDLNFVTATPDDLYRAVQAGLQGEYPLGATKQIELTNGSTVIVRVADNSGANVRRRDGTYAGLILEFENLYSEAKMNTVSTNAGGWGESEMRTITLPAIYALLPEEWKDVIPETAVQTMNGGNQSAVTLLTEYDYLWLPAEKEIFGSCSRAAEMECDALTRFGYYAENDTVGNRIKKLSGTAKTWWLRSAYSSSTASFVTVTSDGSVTFYSAHGTYGVSPCFVI